MKIERRNISREFRVLGDGSTISGYAAVFSVKSEDMGWVEEIAPGAFDKVLASKPDLRSFWNHDTNYVLGRTSAGTMSVSVDAVGLAYTVKLPDTQVARDLSVSMGRGDVRESSFGFVCGEDTWSTMPDGTPYRLITEIEELIDCSPVSIPAFTQATANIRSLPDSMPAEFRSRYEIRADKPKTKHVDGEDLTADSFLIVGDPNKTDTWKLPWKFSSDDKTKSHLRNALARIDQVKGVSDEDLAKAKEKLASLCKQYEIDVTESKSLTYQCTCPCPQCMVGSCGICSADPQCEGAERKSSDDKWREQTMLRLRIAEAE